MQLKLWGHDRVYVVGVTAPGRFPIDIPRGLSKWVRIVRDYGAIELAFGRHQIDGRFYRLNIWLRTTFQEYRQGSWHPRHSYRPRVFWGRKRVI